MMKKIFPTIPTLCFLLGGLVLNATSEAEMTPGKRDAPPPITRPSVVKLVKTESGWQLLRNGKPYFIKGAGGDGSKPMLAAAGGNSFRTWGVDHLDAQLDAAEKLGLSVSVGIWLGHTEQGFDYNNADQVAAQYEMVRQVVLKYKDHPAVLVWSLGNEMEGYGKGDNAAIWSAINNLAALVKKLDPNHPTMTVIAEIGGDKVKNVHRLCPDVDIVGINSYGGAPSIPTRYRQAGGTKPYVLTEFGPPGVWELKKTDWGAAPEPTSTEKAALYRKAYEAAVIAPKGLCLGGYAFTWGNKQEATATWFGLLLPDGSRLGGVDALTELWSGKPPANRCPEVKPLSLNGPAQVEPGAVVQAVLEAADPDGDALKVSWLLQREANAYGNNGDAEATPPTFPGAILAADAKHAEVRMPKEGGGYRLYVTVRDGHGNAATANAPLFVKGLEPAVKTPRARLPLTLYDEADRIDAPYAPTGWMGNVKAIQLDPAWRERPHAGNSCLRVVYRDGGDWGGVVWQNPSNNWGDKPGGLNLTGAKRLTFWARGDKGGEKVAFQFGLIKADKKFHDTANGQLDTVTLSREWRKYQFDLTGRDLSRIVTGFAWVVQGQGAPISFCLDDIRYE